MPLCIIPEELVALKVKVVLDDGHALGHLTEHQNSVTGGFQLGQNPVEKFEFSGRPVHVRAGHDVREVSGVFCVALLDVLEHERMVAKFPGLKKIKVEKWNN